MDSAPLAEGRGPECTKIAHRCSLAILIADEGIAGNSAARIIFTSFHRRENRGSLAIFFAEEIAHVGASKSRAIFPGAVKIAAATAENRAILVHSEGDQQHQIKRASAMRACGKQHPEWYHLAGVLRGNAIRGNTTRNSERKMAL